MHDTPRHEPDRHTSSTGHALAGVGWLDAHFEADRPEYEAILRSVGLRRGWHVLDAGCGSGSFLPLIAAEVGPTGHITALDLAPENIAAVEQRIAGWALDCPVSTQVGSFLDLPFADASFDAVWCANSSQYLTDGDLRTMLAEFRRVARPGGLVAIKEPNAALWNILPGDPVRTWRLVDAMRDTEPQFRGGLRTPKLRRWLEAAGYHEVWQRTTLIERWAPLRSSERQLQSDLFRWMAHVAERATLSEDDHAFWSVARDPDAPEHPINQADFSASEATTLAVGRVPGSIGEVGHGSNDGWRP